MKIAVAGGSGFIGTFLTEYLVEKGHEIFILTRNTQGIPQKKHVTYVEWLTHESRPENVLQNIDAFVNLAGESINSGRWTEKRKERILQSRLKATNELLNLIRKLDYKPNVLINASAIGIYGTNSEKEFTEEDTTPGQDFLASTTKKWENEALQASDLGIRTVFTRFGIVLNNTEGALPRMITPYKFFIGGKVGSGQQWLSWIHIRDAVGLIEFVLENNEIEGALNLTSPEPKQMDDFGKDIGKALNRPHWIPAPSFVLKLLLGEMSTLVLEGQKVFPKKALKHGYHFKYPTLKEALENILK